MIKMNQDKNVLKSCIYFMIKFGTLAIKFVYMIKYSGHDYNMYIWPGTFLPIYMLNCSRGLEFLSTVELGAD